MTEAESRVMWPQPRVAGGGSWRRQEDSPRTLRRVWPASSLISGFWSPEPGEEQCLLFQFVVLCYGSCRKRVHPSLCLAPGAHPGSVGDQVSRCRALVLPLGIAVWREGHNGPSLLLPVRPRATVCWALTGPRPWPQHHLIGPSNNSGHSYYHPHFTDEKTEAQRGA